MSVILQDELWANAVYVKEANAIAVELKKKVCKMTVELCLMLMLVKCSFVALLGAFCHLLVNLVNDVEGFMYYSIIFVVNSTLTIAFGYCFYYRYAHVVFR